MRENWRVSPQPQLKSLDFGLSKLNRELTLKHAQVEPTL